MSLELAIQQNTQALHALIEILARGAMPAPVAAAEATAEAPREEPAPKAKKSKKADAPVGEPAATAEVPETPEAGAAPSTPELSYEEHVKPAIISLSSKKGRDVVIELLSQFGVASGKELVPAQYAEVYEAVQAALA